MENLFAMIEWTPVLVSAVLAFGLGWLWYSPVLFLGKWMDGLPKPPVWQAPMWMPMLSQGVSTLVYAMVINQFLLYEDWLMVLLVALVLMGFIKANGLYCGKSKPAISVEVLYIAAMTLLIAAVNITI